MVRSERVKYPWNGLTRSDQFIKLVSKKGTIVDSHTEEVSAFEAKTRLSELLRETEKGVSFRIFRRGKEVARLTPPSKEDKKQNLKQVLASFQKIQKHVPRNIKIRELIEKKRRF